MNIRFRTWIGFFLSFAGLGFSQVPDFDLPDLNGEKRTLYQQLEKGPVLLDFWATWCKPCIKSLPKLADLEKEFAEQGLVVWAINEDGPRTQAKVEPFVYSLGRDLTVLIDENREVMRQFQVNGLPTSILISPERNIVLRLQGYRPGDEKKIKEKLSELKSD